jgi:peroxiredoxin
LALGLLALGLGTPAKAAPRPGDAAPAFALRDRQGERVSLADLAYPGPERPRRPKQVVVLDFFRTDCEPCRKGLPKLIDLHRRTEGKGVRVILLALLEDEEGESKLDRFLAENPVPFTVLVDAYAAVGKKYVEEGGKVRIPALFVVDRAGVIRERVDGLVAAGLDRVLRRALELTR